MNLALASGVVHSVSAPVRVARGEVTNFILAVDCAKRRNLTVSCAAWDTVGQIVRELAIGDRVVIVGRIENAKRGVYVCCTQVAAIGNLDDRDLERSWHLHLSMGEDQISRAE